MNIYENETINKVYYWQISFNNVRQRVGPIININIDAYICKTIDFTQPIGLTLSSSINNAATCTTKFTVDPDGNMAYYINANELNGVIGDLLSLKN